MSIGAFRARTSLVAKLVGQVRVRIVAMAITAGLFLSLSIAISWIVGGVVLDLAVPLSVPLRLMVWCGWWTVVALAVSAFMFVPALRRPTLDVVALRIERTLGGIQNRLLTVLDLNRGRALTKDARPEMIERLLDQTQSKLFGFQASKVVRTRTMIQNLGLTLCAAAIVVAMVMLLGDRFTITLQRLLFPTADIPPATLVRLVSPGNLLVLEGEPLEIIGRVDRGEAEEINLLISNGDHVSRRYPMRKIPDGSFRVVLDGLEENATYRLEGASTWTRTHTITILERPEIDSLIRQVRFPDYMRIDQVRVMEENVARIEAPESSTVEFVASVSGEPVEGVVQLIDRTFETRTEDRVDERVWFEDDLPRDAVSTFAWKWTTAQPAGGLRSFTFGFDGKPVSMRTRLEPLLLPKEAIANKAVMLMARIDSIDPPTRLVMMLEHDGGRLEVLWGDAADTKPENGSTRVHAGSLPPPDVWTRLEVPMEKIPTLVGRTLSGVTFSIDRGRVVLDRPGWLEHSTQNVQHPVDRVSGEIPAVRGEQGLWIGGIPVLKPTWATVEFRSVQKHPSRAVPAVEIVPTVDRPPSIAMELPGGDLVLSVPIDVDVEAQVFDDWGIDQVAVRIGPDADHLSLPQPLLDQGLVNRPPDTQLAIRTSLTFERLGLAPGKSAAWTLVARDTKGQVVESKVFRVTVVMPPESSIQKTQIPALEQAKREAQEAAKMAESKKETAQQERAEVLAAIGEQPLKSIDNAQTAEAVAKESLQPDGQRNPEKNTEAQARTAEAQKIVDEAIAKLESPQKQNLNKLDAQLEQQKNETKQLAEALAKAAEQAKASPLVPDKQAKMLAELAADAAKLQQALEQKPLLANEAAKVERLVEAPTPAEIAAQTQQIAEKIEDVENHLDASAVAVRLDSLTQDLQSRAQALESLATARDTQAELADQATNPPADASQSKSQPTVNAPANVKAIDQLAKAQLKLLEHILDQPISKSSKPAGALAENSATAAQDINSPNKETNTSPQTPLPASSESALVPEQPTGEDTKSSPADATGDALSQKLKQGAENALDVAQMTTELSSQLSGKSPIPKSLLKNLETQAEIPAKNPGDVPAQPAPTVDGESPSTLEKTDQSTEGMADQIESLLKSDQVKQALAMAERAQRAQAQAAARQAQAEAKSKQNGNQKSQEPPSNPGQNIDSEALTTVVRLESAEALRGLDASQRAAIYRLPPRIRDPLLEGMRQRGPAAYQDVIDTYFRQLGKEIQK